MAQRPTSRTTSDRALPNRLPRLLVLGGLLAVLSGCQQPLFSPRETRTQYDRYDRSRNQFEPQYVEDEYGARQPNLRGRLTPKA